MKAKQRNRPVTAGPCYTEHADSANLDYRLRVMAHREARGQYLRVLEELDAGIEITQPMSADELRARLAEALDIHAPMLDWETGCDLNKLRAA